jgi:hypothetical protein
MGTIEQDQSEELSQNTVLNVILRVLYAIRTSFSLFFIAMGTVIVAIGLTARFVPFIPFIEDGVFAGLSVIIGITIMIYGAIVYIAAQFLM